MKKSEKILKLLGEGKSINEIAKAVKCTKALVYTVRRKMMGDKADRIAEEAPIPEFLKVRNDPINHPAHYTHGGIEAIDVIEAWELNYKLGNVLKYISRAPFKENYLQDLKKARWYLDREIDKYEPQT
jgi:hypothetical protein